jgi:hypothetical protein
VSLHSLARAFAAATFVALPVATSAQPITYVFAGTGSGTFGAQAFTAAPFTIRVASDMSTVPTPVGSDVLTVLNLSAEIDIAGVTTNAAFANLVRVFVNQTTNGVGVSRNAGSDLFDVVAGAGSGLSTYTLTAPFGPITGTPFALHQFAGIVVGGQTLTFTGASGSATFEAVVAAVPEPSTWMLLGTGLAAVGALRWRRRRTV